MREKSTPKPKKTVSPDVADALDLLTEYLDAEIGKIDAAAASESKPGRRLVAREYLDFADQLEAFGERVNALKAEWQVLTESAQKQPDAEVKAVLTKTFHGRAEKGRVTAQSDMVRPLLESLVEMNGSGDIAAVTARVEAKLKGRLTEQDLIPRKTKSRTITWKNNLQWTRNTLVHKLGLMSGDSKRGTWAISDEGRAWLKAGK